MAGGTRAGAAALALLVAAVALPLDVAASRPRPERVGASGITAVSVPAPDDATAVLANIVMTDALAPGYITADRCSALAPGPQARANGNYDAGPPVANVSVVRHEAGGFCIANQSPVNLIVDVQGWFAPARPGGTGFLPTPPRRVLDTRDGGGMRPGDGWITEVRTAAASGSAAVLVNIATTDATAEGYVTAGLCSVLRPGQQERANGNYSRAVTSSGLAVVPVDAEGRFCIFNLRPVHLVVDVQGEFAEASPGALPYSSTDPARLADTRNASPLAPVAGSLLRVETGLGGTAAAALVNIAMVDATAPGYITAGPCSQLVAGPQARANGNHRTGGAVANLSVVGVDRDGSFCIFNQSPVHLVVDLQGWFGANGTQRYFPMSGLRVLDTRPPGGEPPIPLPLPPPSTVPPSTGTVPMTEPAAPPPGASGGPRTSCRSAVHIGDSTSVGMISTSVIPEAEGRLDAQYRRVGVTTPLMEISGARSIVETLRGQVNARDAAAQIRAAGYRGCWVFALGTTDTANLALSPGGVSRRERIDRMMTVAAGEPVVWVNTRTIVPKGEWSDPWMQLWNHELRTAQARWPNLRIYDWSSVVQTRWFSDDGIHYTSDGYRWRAVLIANALASAYPG